MKYRDVWAFLALSVNLTITERVKVRREWHGRTIGMLTTKACIQVETCKVWRRNLHIVIKVCIVLKVQEKWLFIKHIVSSWNKNYRCPLHTCYFRVVIKWQLRWNIFKRMLNLLTICLISGTYNCNKLQSKKRKEGRKKTRNSFVYFPHFINFFVMRNRRVCLRLWNNKLLYLTLLYLLMGIRELLVFSFS